MLTPVILPLRCPGCGGALHGTPQSVLFWCEDCRGIREVVVGELVSRPTQTARPARPGAGRLCHLPVWGLRVRAAWEWSREVRGGSAGWTVPDWVYVTGFALSNGFYFGDPGLLFTQKRVELSPGDPAPLLGGTRSLEEAKIFVEPHLLSLLDRRVDVTGVELSCAIDQAVVWAIPYYDDGLTLTDGILGCKLPGAALDEIGALRAWWERQT
jgi:hypothetical protein